MKLSTRPSAPPALRADEEALIEAVLRWAAAERLLHGRLPSLPARVVTLGGDIVLLCDPRAHDDEPDASVLRFRMIELF